MSLNEQQQAELDELMGQDWSMTKRVTCHELEKVLYLPFKCLDHGLVRVVDYMGADSAIVQAARVSYGLGTKKVSEDRGLIDYLLRNFHTTPFEMCEIKLHCKLPIFVARQWIRHRTANVNEYSARYSILAKEFYIPERENLAPQSKANRQGRSAEMLDEEEAEIVRTQINHISDKAYWLYKCLLNEEDSETGLPHNDHPGVARELSRMVLPVNFYTEWYWKVDLHNLLHFLALRLDPHAQYEIRVYADIIWNIVQMWCPMAAEAFENCIINGARLTGRQLEIIRQYVGANKDGKIHDYKAANLPSAGHEDWFDNNGIGKREWDELVKVLQRK